MTNEELNNWKHPYNKNISYEECIIHDEHKKKIALENGYRYIEVWDCDGYESNKEKIINFYDRL